MELIINNLNKSYSKNSKGNNSKHNSKLKVLNKLDFNVKNHEIYSLLGANGAGKSTLLSCIGGILTPDSGKIKLIMKEGEIDVVANPKIGKKHSIFCFQDPKFDNRLDVKKNLEFHMNIHNISKMTRKKLIKEYLELFGLWKNRKSRISTLSGGQRKQLENIRGFLIAKAFKNKKELLFITDEPTAYCDINAQKIIWDEILGIAEYGDNCVLFATNDLNEAKLLTNGTTGKIGFLKHGEISFDGSIKALQYYLDGSRNTLLIEIADYDKKGHDMLLQSFKYKLNTYSCDYKLKIHNPQKLSIQHIKESEINDLMKFTVNHFLSKNVFLEKIERKKPDLNELFR